MGIPPSIQPSGAPSHPRSVTTLRIVSSRPFTSTTTRQPPTHLPLSSGRNKRAPAGLVWALQADSKPIPRPGDLSVVTLFSGHAVCVIETSSIQIVPFSEVDADFAATEGEGDGSLAYWQETH